MGNEVTDIDSTIFGMVSQFVYHDNGPINRFIKGKN